MNTNSQATGDSIGSIIKFKGRLVKIIFPRIGHGSGDFAITIFSIEKLLSGEVNPSFSGFYKTEIPVKGNMPSLNYSEIYIIQASLIDNKKYGLQYDVEMMRTDYDLSSPEKQKIFLNKFLSDTQVENLYLTLPNPLEVLENGDIQTLATVKGIGTLTAEKIIDKYESNKDYGEAYIVLSEYGLTIKAIKKLIKFYGSPDTAIQKIQENPYRLIKEVEGYGWNKADKIAIDLGIATNDEKRVRAYSEYYLTMIGEQQGASWINIDTFLTDVQEICNPIEDSILIGYVKKMLTIEEKNLYPVLFFDGEKQRISLYYYYHVESSIAKEIERIKNGEKHVVYDEEKKKLIIRDIEIEQGWDYVEEQKEAIERCLDNQVSLLTGRAGTGKTNTVKAMANIWQKHGLRIAQVALSGRASSKLTEVTGIQGRTIHKLLGYNPKIEKFEYNKDNLLPYDVIIVDETSMIGGQLFLDLIEAIPTNSQLLLIGDYRQLEPIGLANVFKDLIFSEFIPVSNLTKIHRQAARSGIITESIKISNSEQLFDSDFEGEETRGELQDLKLCVYKNGNLSFTKLIEQFKELYLIQKISINDIQIIVPLRTRGEISCKILNEEVQLIVQKNAGFKSTDVTYFDNGNPYVTKYYINDKIIITKNNYDILTIEGKNEPIFNGNIGYIKQITDKNMIITLTEQGDIVLDKENWNNMQLGYAITVHKKQGDSSPYIIIGFDTSAYALYSKEILYTAITRARQKCILVTQNKAFRQAVTITGSSKQTWLKDLLKKSIDNIEKII